jgi:hypothetical protein
MSAGTRGRVPIGSVDYAGDLGIAANPAAVKTLPEAQRRLICSSGR